MIKSITDVKLCKKKILQINKKPKKKTKPGISKVDSSDLYKLSEGHVSYS